MRISREERLILIELFLFRESRGLLISTQFRPIFSSRLFSFEKGMIVKREKYNTQSNEPRFFQPCDLIQTIFEKFLNTKENYVYIYIYIHNKEISTKTNHTFHEPSSNIPNRPSSTSSFFSSSSFTNNKYPVNIETHHSHEFAKPLFELTLRINPTNTSEKDEIAAEASEQASNEERRTRREEGVREQREKFAKKSWKRNERKSEE